MSKINLKLAYDYINGEDLGDNNIEELENNPTFMKLVFNITKDKNMYYLCGPRVKDDIDFIETLITLFKDDEKFIYSVTNDFLVNHKEDDVLKLELLLQVMNVIKDEDIKSEYNFILDSIYVTKRVIIDLTKDELTDIEVMSYVGLGFAILEDIYEDSKICLTYFAKSMIEEIFNSYKNLETVIHEEFNSKEDLKKYGISCFLIDYIRTYDENLANFVCANINVLDDTKNKVKKIINNWDKFNTEDESRRFDSLLDRVNRYFLDNDVVIPYDLDLIIYYVASMLKINDKLVKHDHRITEEEYIRVMDAIRNHEIDEKNMEFHELSYIRDIKDIMLSVITPKVYEEPDDYIESEKKKDTIILSFKNKKI